MKVRINHPMKRMLLTGSLLFILGTTNVWAGTQYLSSLPDVPLMPQMSEIRDTDVTFDKAEGRIVQEAVRASHLSAAQVVKFYNETLPALGWTRLSATPNASRFSRNGEQLIVNVEKLAAEGLVGFAVSPIQP